MYPQFKRIEFCRSAAETFELNRKIISASYFLPCSRLHEYGKVGPHIFWTWRRKCGLDRRRLLSSHKRSLMQQWQHYWTRFSFQQQLEYGERLCCYSISNHHKTGWRSMEVKAIITTLTIRKGNVLCQNWAEKWWKIYMNTWSSLV